jgi:hypothetical protein
MKTDDQELDDVLRRAFRLDAHDGPSDDFQRRVMASLPERGRWALPAPIKQALRVVSAGVAVAVAAVILVLALTNRPGSGPVSPNSVGSGAGSPSAPAASSAPATILAHARIWDLEFDYPASWVAVGSAEAPALYLSILALGSVGTEELVETCVYPSPDPGHLDYVCETTWDPSAEVQVRFEWDSRDEAWSAWRAVSGQAPADDSLVIAGLPARVRTSTDGRVPGSDEVVPDADRITVWDVASRDRMWWSFRITAVVRGPNAEALQAQVNAMLASAAFNPRVEPLVDTAAARAEALRAGVAQMRDQAAGTPPFPDDYDNPMSAACFSDVPGATTEATIDGTVFIGYRLTQPLEVRCTSLIEPTPFQMWKMTLRYDWAAIDGKAAGSASRVALLMPDLVSGTGGDIYGVAGMPYLEALPPNP